MSHRTKIKICGIRNQPALSAAVAGGADFVGFVHWTGSPRYIEQDAASALSRGLPDSVTPVGLYVDGVLEEIVDSSYCWIQLHGNEDEETCDQLKAAGKQIIRGFRFDEDDPIIVRAKSAIEASGIEPWTAVTCGGSDANEFNDHGLAAVVISVGYLDIHTNEEAMPLDQLNQLAEVCYSLMLGK